MFVGCSLGRRAGASSGCFRRAGFCTLLNLVWMGLGSRGCVRGLGFLL